MSRTRPPTETSVLEHDWVDAHDSVLISPWSGHLRVAERGLGHRNEGGGQRPWENAHLRASETLDWESLIEAGRACLQIGGATGGRPAAEPAARRSYFAALYRACRENSLEGILRAAKAFDDLGDREIVEECLGLVELRAEGEQTRRHMAALVGRLGLAHAPLSADVAADTIGAPWTDTADTWGRGMP